MGKQIKDLNIIASIESNDKILVDRGGKGYSANLSELLSSTEIEDIDTIRANAALGATALQSVPPEYITDSDLTDRNYATKTDLNGYVPKSNYNSLVNTINGKQDKISDLSDIRNGAALGSTALQEIPAEYVTESILEDKNYVTTSVLNQEIVTISDRVTRLENNPGLGSSVDSRSKILWLGTSIPKGDGANNAYPVMVGEALGVTVYNMAQGGSHLTFDQNAPTWTNYSQLSSQYTKHYSLTGTLQEYENKMRPILETLGSKNELGGGTVDAWMRLFTANSFEKIVIPYIDGTIDTCDTVIIDHGFNDKNQIFQLAKSHKDETKDNGDKWADNAAYNAGQYYPFNGANDGFGWIQTVGDNRYLNSWGVYTATWDELNYVKEGKAWYKSDYFKAFMYLVQQIWKVNPRIKIIVGNFYSLHFGNPWGEGDAQYITKYIIEANKQIAKLLGFQCVNVFEYTGLSNKKIILPDGTTTTDMLMFAPDGIHPSSDTTGESNRRIAAAYINALQGALYR